MKKFPFIKLANLWYTISALTVIASIVVLVMFGLKLGIDFTGGSLLEVSFASVRPEIKAVVSVLVSNNVKDSVIQTAGNNKVIIRSRFLKEDEHQAVLKGLTTEFGATSAVKEERFETIGAAVSDQLRSRAIWAIIFVNLGIILYVAYAFRGVSRPVPSWQYGLLAIVALVHDVLVVLGVFAVLGHFKGYEVNIDFVVALLTVLGFSVTDTIVVYDRVRENLMRRTSGETFADTVNNGLNQTLMRSLNTTATVVLPLLALFYLGGASIHLFALALLIGMISGAYSSIFIASPLLVLAQRFADRKK